MDGATAIRRYGPAVALVGTVGLLRAATIPHTYDPATLADAESRTLRHVQTPLHHRFVQAGRHQLHTVVAGEGPPLVILHGHGGGAGVWLYNYDALAKHFRLYVIDWLGWGRSERPTFQGRSPESARNWWLNSLEDWRQAMGLTNFYLLGHSLGGWVAAEYALDYSRHVRHLILENPAGLVDDTELHKSLYYYISPQRLIQALGRLGPRLVSHGCAEQVERCPYDGAALIEYYYQLSIAPLSGQHAFERVLNPLHWTLPLLPRAERLTVPTTILWGVLDDLLRVRHAHQFQARVPSSRLVTFPNACHSPHSEDIERFNEAVIRCKDDSLFERGHTGIGRAS